MKYSAPQYAKALHELAEEAPAAKRRGVIREFLASLAKNDSLKNIAEIIREFELLSDTQAKTHRVTIRTPERLPAGRVAKHLPFKVRVATLMDVRLKGGAVLEVDDVRIDNSIAMRLERAREAFTR